MTGFASFEAQHGDITLSWELRSVNGRGLDLRFRMPDGFGATEPVLRKRLAEHVTRGSVSLSLRMSRSLTPSQEGLDPGALSAALARIAQVEQAAQLDGLLLSPVSADAVLSMKALAEGTEARRLPETSDVMEDVDALLESFLEMRTREGLALCEVLHDQISHIEALVEQATEAAKARGETQVTRLRAAVAIILDDTEIDETRLMQEVAILAVKADVTEEIDRLHAHVKAARGLLDTGGPVGRKLDFLMQEFNREANTLCSKSQDAALTAIGLDLKLAIDQTREQVQNVE